MDTVKDEIRTLLDRLPDDCTIEDVQYHLYVLEKIRRGPERAEREGTLTQEEAERAWKTRCSEGIRTRRKKGGEAWSFGRISRFA